MDKNDIRLKPIIKIIGKGNHIKTQIMNLLDIANYLQITTNELIKYLQDTLGASGTDDTIFGVHELNTIHNIILKYKH